MTVAKEGATEWSSSGTREDGFGNKYHIRFLLYGLHR